MPGPSHPDRRMVVAVDMEHYSRQDNRRQYQSQQVFRRMVAEAAEGLGLDRGRWSTQPSGDGELAVLPRDVAEVTVVGDFAPLLDRLLRAHNRDLVPEARVRLRVAVHSGLVHLDGANGVPGEAVVTTCRLVDAPPLKRALAAFPEAAVGLIVSDRIFQEIVRQRYGRIRPDRFRRVPVRLPEKRFEHVAWISVPDEDVTALPGFDDAAPAEGAGPGDGTPERAGSRPTASAGPPEAGASRFHFGTVTTYGPTAFGDHNQVSGSDHRGPAGERP